MTDVSFTRTCATNKKPPEKSLAESERRPHIHKATEDERSIGGILQKSQRNLFATAGLGFGSRNAIHPVTTG